MSIIITPLHLGSIKRDKSVFTYLKNPGVQVKLPIISWLIETDDTKILVDTGTDAPEETAEYHKPLERNKEQELPYLLNLLGVRANEIKTVILTHLHWDHCHNNNLFPYAEFIVQREELRYAIAPLFCHSYSYDIIPIAETNFAVIDGDKQIVPEVSVLFTPGHSPGSQSVLVEGKNTKVLLAGDMIPLYENWEKKLLIPSGIFVNLEDYYKSFEKIKKIKPDFFLPGHEIRVFEKSKYTIY